MSIFRNPVGIVRSAYRRRRFDKHNKRYAEAVISYVKASIERVDKEPNPVQRAVYLNKIASTIVNVIEAHRTPSLTEHPKKERR